MQSNKGSTLVFVLLLMVVFAILGTSILSISLAETKFTENEMNRTQAYYLAQSGADTVAEYIERHPSELNDLLGRTTDDINLGAGIFRVKVRELVPNILIELESTGIVKGVERTIKLQVQRQSLQSIFNNAIASKNNLNVSAMDKVKGPLYSNGSINANAKTRDEADPEYPNMPFKYETPELPSLSIYSISPFVDGIIDDTTTLDLSYQLNGLNIGNSDTITFDASSSKIQIVVPYIESKGNIVILGNNPVEIFITGTGSVFQTNQVTNVSEKNFKIYLMKDTSLTIKTGNNSFTGAIYGPEATVIMESNATATGSVIAETFSGASNSNIIFSNLNSDIPEDGTIVVFRRGEWK